MESPWHAVARNHGLGIDQDKGGLCGRITGIESCMCRASLDNHCAAFVQFQVEHAAEDDRVIERFVAMREAGLFRRQQSESESGASAFADIDVRVEATHEAARCGSSVVAELSTGIRAPDDISLSVTPISTCRDTAAIRSTLATTAALLASRRVMTLRTLSVMFLLL